MNSPDICGLKDYRSFPVLRIPLASRIWVKHSSVVDDKKTFCLTYTIRLSPQPCFLFRQAILGLFPLLPFASVTENKMGLWIARETRWLWSPAAHQTAWRKAESLASQITFWPPSSARLQTFGWARTSDSILHQCPRPSEQCQEDHDQERMAIWYVLTPWQQTAFSPRSRVKAKPAYHKIKSTKFALANTAVENLQDMFSTFVHFNSPPAPRRQVAVDLGWPCRFFKTRNIQKWLVIACHILWRPPI